MRLAISRRGLTTRLNRTIRRLSAGRTGATSRRLYARGRVLLRGCKSRQIDAGDRRVREAEGRAEVPPSGLRRGAHILPCAGYRGVERPPAPRLLEPVRRTRPAYHSSFFAHLEGFADAEGGSRLRLIHHPPRAQPIARFLRWTALRSKNSAWLTSAETVDCWYGLDTRNAGSGRSPVRKRSG